MKRMATMNRRPDTRERRSMWGRVLISSILATPWSIQVLNLSYSMHSYTLYDFGMKDIPSLYITFYRRVHRSGFGNTSISRRVPMPLQRVPAPSVCEILFGKLETICAIQVGSVRGVLSSFLGRYYTLSVSLGQAVGHEDAPCSLGRRAPPTRSSRG